MNAIGCFVNSTFFWHVLQYPSVLVLQLFTLYGKVALEHRLPDFESDIQDATCASSPPLHGWPGHSSSVII